MTKKVNPQLERAAKQALEHARNWRNDKKGGGKKLRPKKPSDHDELTVVFEPDKVFTLQ